MYLSSVIEVIVTDEFIEWYRGLGDGEVEAVTRVVEMLVSAGLALPFPYSSAIRGSKIALRELRATCKKSELRVFYAFDPARDAVLLIGGDKGGDKAFYERMVPLAERIWAEYLDENFGKE